MNKKSESRSCLASFLLLVARGILSFYCVTGAIAAIVVMIWPNEIAKLYPSSLDAPEVDFISYLWLSGLLGGTLVGLYGVFTRNPVALKIFAMITSIFVLRSAIASYYAYHEDSVPESGITMNRSLMSISWIQMNAKRTSGRSDYSKILTKCCGQEDRQWRHMIPELRVGNNHPLACCPTESRSFLTANDSCHFDAAFIAECQAKFGQSESTWLAYDMLTNLLMIILALSIAKPSNSARANFWGLPSYATP